jgi:hypothetical protein
MAFYCVGDSIKKRGANVKLLKTLDTYSNKLYSRHPKAGPSGFQMVISWTLFGSGFRIPFEIRSENFSASLDRFGMNKIFVINLFFIKRSRLAPFETRTQKSRFRMVKTKWPT